MRKNAALLAVAAAVAGTAVGAGPRATVRGITVSTHGGGRDWGSDQIGPTFDDLKRLGSNWVAIHPYARIRANGAVEFRPIDPNQAPRWLRHPIDEAHARGLKIMIKPHLAYWGSPFSWRGDIRFAGEDEWQRFFESYRRWIVAVAAASRDADAFAVGTELDRTLQREQDWRRVIAEVRGVSPAPLTYAANWSDYEAVTFWDALDAIGVQAYFPLAERESPRPDPQQLARAWAEGMARLRAFAERNDRYVVFTELGYTHSFAAPVEPWSDRDDGPEAEPVAEACLRAALEAIEGEPRVLGAFLWKWFPRPRTVGRNFALDTPRMRRAIRSVWKR